MLNKCLVLLLIAAFCPCLALAQGNATTSRVGDLQLGGGYSMAQPDYGTANLSGFNLYSTFDFRSHIGIEADFRQDSAHNATLIYERTYEIGPRYFYHFGRYMPYAKFLIGRGVFNYPPYSSSPTVSSGNLAYDLLAFGGGLDIAVIPRINVRVDYEYQDWLNFQNSSLTPDVFSIGVAYHFGSGNLSIR